MKAREPRVLSRNTVFESPYVKLVEKHVDFPWHAATEVYHDLDLADYVAAVARTADGYFPLVRQYRPAIEAFSWELPAGMCDAGETPARTCARELLEETGLEALAIRDLGTFHADTGRLANAVHAYAVETGPPDPAFEPEPGMSLRFVKEDSLLDLIDTGEIRLISHVAAILLALRGRADG